MLMIKTFKVLFFIIVIITCIILGLWQIDRANEKAYLYHAFNERISKNPIQFEVIKSNPVDFTKIIITGTYISNKQFLLDNKIFNKKAGYEVISPMLFDDQIVLINRGWVSNNNRQSLPNIDIRNVDSQATGYIYKYKDFYQLSEDFYKNDWPLIIQNIEIDKIKQMFKYKVFPYVLIMSEDQENSYNIQTIYKKNSDLKHYMYAGQWFLFAFIGIIFMIILLRKDLKR